MIFYYKFYFHFKNLLHETLYSKHKSRISYTDKLCLIKNFINFMSLALDKSPKIGEM
jgi:hypothetical protein